MHKLTFIITCANNSMIKFRRREGRMSGGRGKGRKSGTKGRPFIQRKVFLCYRNQGIIKRSIFVYKYKYDITFR